MERSATRTPASRNFDLAPDGKRFAVLMTAGEIGEQEAPTHLTFLHNFFDELERRVPVEQTSRTSDSFR